MELVQAGQNFSFNYTDPFQRNSLFIAFSLYDVTTGSAVFVQKINGVYASNGSYMASYSAVAGKIYLVSGLVYTDNTYATVDTTSAQTTGVYQVMGSLNVLTAGFAYASYDYSNVLHLRATVWNMTSGSPVSAGTAAMTSVANGVYYGSFTGILDNTYAILPIVYTNGTFATPDLNYAPASPAFSSVQLPVAVVVEGTAHLIGQGQGQVGVITVNPPIHFTQGDNAILNLIAVDVNGNPVDLTGATFSTQINGANGVGPIIFGNSQHAANIDQVNFEGNFTLTLSPSDTANCGLGDHKEILTTITIGGNSVYFRGFNALQVYAPVPIE